MTNIFCGKCNKATEHTISVVKKEFVAKCQTPECDHFFKFPGTTSKDELKSWIDRHNADNAPAAPPSEDGPDAAMLAVIDGI